MLPFDQREPDPQYRDLLQRILNKNEEFPTEHGEPALTIVGHTLCYRLDNGFPAITERDIVSAPKKSAHPSGFLQAIGEICAFLNGAQTQAELEQFGCYWWGERWLTADNCARFELPPGDMGPGSYGAAWRRYLSSDGPFDQLTAFIEGIRRNPFSRHHVLTAWIPPYILVGEGEKRKAVVPPCHGDVYARVNGDGELTVHHTQRSGDVPVGVIYNLVGYGIFTMALAQGLGLKAKELVFHIKDAHIYRSQIEKVREILRKTGPERLPTVTIDPSVTDILALRPHHVVISDYHPQLPRMWIPTPL